MAAYENVMQMYYEMQADGRMERTMLYDYIMDLFKLRIPCSSAARSKI